MSRLLNSLVGSSIVVLCVSGCGSKDSTTSAESPKPKTDVKGEVAKKPLHGPSRVDVKHALDPDAAGIDPNPKETTIEEMLAQKMPDDQKGDLSEYQKKRAGSFEKTVWSVDAKVKSVVLKKDGDYYMVLESKGGASTVVEVPDPKLCAGSKFEPQIAATRADIEKRFHPTSVVKEVNEDAKIQGVGFFGWKGRPGSGSSSSARLMPGTGISWKGKKG